MLREMREQAFRYLSKAGLLRTSPKVISSPHLRVPTLEVSPKSFPISFIENCLDCSRLPLPAVGVGLRQSDVGEDAVDELARHGIKACRAVVKGGD